MNPAGLLKCGRCGWVHVAMTAADLPPGVDLAQARQCFKCQAPAAEMKFCEEEDAPKGATIPGILYAHADKIAARRATLDRLSLLDQELGLA